MDVHVLLDCTHSFHTGGNVARPVVLVSAILMMIAHAGAAQSLLHEWKPAWQWTDEERLAGRFDPASIAERASPAVLAEFGFHPPAPPKVVTESSKAAAGPITFVILGERNPELFMPFELFDFLIDTAFKDDAQDRASWRKMFTDRGEAPLPDHFWSRLEGAARPYLDVQHELATLNQQWMAAAPDGRGTLAPRLLAVKGRLCGARAAALAAARREFGISTFDRILYERAAPGLHQWSSDPLPAETLRSIEGGCR
jgi:hypothetical protein